MRRTYRRHKLRITPATLAAYKAARVRELERQGCPVPTTLLPHPEDAVEPHEQQQRLPF